MTPATGRNTLNSTLVMKLREIADAKANGNSEPDAMAAELQRVNRLAQEGLATAQTHEYGAQQ